MVEVEAIVEKTVSISGRIRDHKTGSGIQGIIRRLFGASSTITVMSAPVDTDADGRFVVECFRDNDSGKLWLRAQGHRPKTVEVIAGVKDLGDIYLESE